MNKLLTKIVGAALGVAMTVGVGVAVAVNANKGVQKAEATAGSITFVTSATNIGYDKNTMTNLSMTTSGVTITFSEISGKTNSPARVQMTKNSTVTSTVFPDSITSITLTDCAHTGTKSDGGFTVAGSANGTTWTTIHTESSMAPDRGDVAISSISSGYTYFKVTNGNSRVLQLSSIVVAYGANKQVEVTGVTIEGSSSGSTTISSGYINDTVQLTGAVTYKQGSEYQDGNNGLTWSIKENNKSSTVNQTGLVTLKANETFTVVATSTEDNTKSAEYAITTQNLVVRPQITVQHNSATTTNVSGDATSHFTVDASLWTITANTNDSNNNLGLNSAGDFRLYYASNGNGVSMTISSKDPSYVFTTITINYKSGKENAQVKAGSSVVTDTDNVYTINNKVVTIQNISTTSGNQVQINSIVMNFKIEERDPSIFIGLVDDIPSSITAGNYDDFVAAVAACDEEYENLTSTQKALAAVVTAKEKLETARAKIYQYHADAVIALINALPNPVSISDYTHHADIAAARAAYNGLTDYEKTLVSNYGKLQSCEAADALYAPKVYTINATPNEGHTIGDTDNPSTQTSQDLEALETNYPTPDGLEWHAASNVYGKDSKDSDAYYLRLGVSGSAGYVELKTSQEYLKMTEVVVNARYWKTSGTPEGQFFITDGTHESSVKTWSSNSGFSELTYDVSSWDTDTIRLSSNSSGKRVIISSITITVEIEQGYLDAVAFEKNYILAPKGNLIEYPASLGPTGIDGTACIDNGYYADAKAQYDNVLSNSAKYYFATHDSFAKARERFAAWALKATGKVLSFDENNNYDIVLNSQPVVNTFETVNGSAAAIIAIVSVISLSAVAGFFLLRKRKEQ